MKPHTPTPWPAPLWSAWRPHMETIIEALEYSIRWSEGFAQRTGQHCSFEHDCRRALTEARAIAADLLQAAEDADRKDE